MKAANRDFTREINQFNILNSIRQAGGISRVEISEKTGQSRSSVTNITALLIEQGLIREEDRTSAPHRGRRRVMLSLNPNAAYTAGIKVAAFRLSFAVVDFVGNLKSSLALPLRVADFPDEALAEITEKGVRQCVERAGLRIEDMSGCGLAMPGFVDSATGSCLWSPLKEGSSSIRQSLAEQLNMDVYLENDANSVTVASQWFGLGKGVDNFLVVTIEQGLGMGIVLDGKLYQGALGIGAEFGHMVLVPDGEPCRCGKYGCIEAYTADSGILRRAKIMLSRRRRVQFDVDNLTIEEVTKRALEGDRGLRTIFRQGGEILGQGVAGLIQIFNPQMIIITGEGVRAGKMLFNPMHKSLKTHVNKEQAAVTEIVIQEWNESDWARGAAGFVLGELYKSPLKKINRQR